MIKDRAYCRQICGGGHIMPYFSIQLISHQARDERLWGVDYMKELAQDRAEILGEYILDTGATVRATAKVFKISKSTVHTDATKRNGFLIKDCIIRS